MTMAKTKSKKSNLPLGKPKLKKDPGIPRLPEVKERLRNRTKQTVTNMHASSSLDPDKTMASEPTLSTLALQAQAVDAAANRAENPSSSTSFTGKTKEQMRRYYLKTLHRVIDQSDIIILVLDARDPEGCRSRLVEEEVRRREMEGKKLVFVLNKIDLIPRSNAQAWLRHLRHSTPTLPFLSSAASQHQRTNISSKTAPSLLKLLKAYKPKAGSVTVGVVGYPNVGKSSLINSLKRSKVCAVAAQAGHTKELQSVQLERGMRIVDSPGVVFDDDDFDDGKGQKKTNVLLRNVTRVEDVDDPIAVLEEILSRTDPLSLQKIYNLPAWSSPFEFLTMLAMTSGRLLKGGTPDLNSAARQVLQDWNHQKIPYFTEPPAIHPSLVPSVVPSNANSSSQPTIAPGAESVGQAQILSTFSKSFEIEGLFGAADDGAFGEGSGDVAMDTIADEDGDVFFDAVEGHAMDDGEGQQMRMDDNLKLSPGSRKRPHSPSSAYAPAFGETPAYATRQPKRLRRTKDTPAYDAPLEQHMVKHTDRGNPLSRRNLKKEAKRLRKLGRIKAGTGTGMMEVDEVAGLQFTFMTQ